MVLYWSPKLDMRTHRDDELHASINSFANAAICEVYFATEFLKKVGHTPTMTLADSWYAYATYFCIVDYYSIDLYWPKYRPRLEYRYKFYDYIRNADLLDFAEWLNLYIDLNNKAYIPEKSLSKKLGETVYD